MKRKRTYIAPVSEILVMAAEDVLTSSYVEEENDPDGNENSNHNSNKHEDKWQNKWPDGKPGNGFGDKNHDHYGPPGQLNKP